MPMPVTKSATKKLRVDRRRTIFNLRLKRRYKKAIKVFMETKTIETLKRAYALIDRAVKRHIIHRNKAARLKSQVAKALVKEQKKAVEKTKKPKTKKTTKTRKSSRVTKKTK